MLFDVKVASVMRLVAAPTATLTDIDFIVYKPGNTTLANIVGFFFV
jgi:hypothetical protein